MKQLPPAQVQLIKLLAAQAVEEFFGKPTLIANADEGRITKKATPLSPSQRRGAAKHKERRNDKLTP